jgi:hypothetical protein
MNIDKESPIAKVRNQLSPIVSYFSLMKELRIMHSQQKETVEEINKQLELERLVEESYQYIQDTNLVKLLQLIRNDNLWFDNHDFIIDLTIALTEAFEAGERHAHDCKCGECDFCQSKGVNEPNFLEWFKSFKVRSQELPYLSLKGKL